MEWYSTRQKNGMAVDLEEHNTKDNERPITRCGYEASTPAVTAPPAPRSSPSQSGLHPRRWPAGRAAVCRCRSAAPPRPS